MGLHASQEFIGFGERISPRMPSRRNCPCKVPSHPARGFPFLCYTRGMKSSVEYLFAADIRLADEAARRQGWRVHGRSGWIKPDGVEVNFICLEEQLSVVGMDVTIYFVGELSERTLQTEVDQAPQMIWTRCVLPSRSSHIACHCPRCRVTRLRPIGWLPRISMGLTIAQLSEGLRCAECGGPLPSVKL
jgi:hypothetical protein